MAYRDLPLKERHAIIKAGVANGVHKLSEIEARYNAFIADSTDYDMEAYARENPNDVFSHEGHFTDKFKKPNHPTFSTDSKYSTEEIPGGTWSKENGRDVYEPSDYVINQQGGWNNFLRNFQSQEQGTGAVPVFRGGVMLPEVEVHSQANGGSITSMKQAASSSSKLAAFTSTKLNSSLGHRFEEGGDKKNSSISWLITDWDKSSTPEEVRARLFASQVPTTTTARIFTTTKEDIEKRKKETERLEFAQKIRPTLEQAVNTMSIGSNFNTSTMSNEALLDLGSRLSNQWNTVLMAANPVESAVGVITGKVGEKVAIGLNNTLGNPISNEAAAIAGSLVGGTAGARRAHVAMPNLRTSVYNRVEPFDYNGHLKDLIPIAKDNIVSTVLLGKKIKPWSYDRKMEYIGYPDSWYTSERIARDMFLRDRLGIPFEEATYKQLINGKLPYILDATASDGTNIYHFNPEYVPQIDAIDGNPTLTSIESTVVPGYNYDVFTGAGGKVGAKKVGNTIHMYDRWDTKPFERIYKMPVSTQDFRRNHAGLFDLMYPVIKNFDPIEIISARPAPIQYNINPTGNENYEIFNTLSSQYNNANANAITASIHAQGGPIHISPSKRGTFTAAATKHGKSVQAFASQVLAHKENYSPAMVRKAVFAHNSKSWKHSTGGPLYPFSFSKDPLPAVRYADGGLFEWVKGLFSPKDSTTTTTEELQRPTPQGLNYAELRRRQAYIESGFDNNAKSKAGAVGMFQIIPAVLVDYNKANSTSYTPEDLTDQTINASIRDWYMGKLADRSWIKKGDANDSIQYAKSLAAYNFGPTATLRKLNEAKTAGVDIYDSWDWLQHMPTETQDYVNFILRGQNNSAHRNDTMYEITKKAKSSVVKKL